MEKAEDFSEVEVIRISLPVGVTPLAVIGEAIDRHYKKSGVQVYIKQDGPHLVFFYRKELKPAGEGEHIQSGEGHEVHLGPCVDTKTGVNDGSGDAFG